MTKFKEMISNNVNTARAVVGGVAVTAPLALGTTITSFAADASGSSLTDSVTTSLVESVNEMAASIGSAIGQILPVAIPLVGAVLVVTIGLKVFKQVAGK